MSRFIALLVIFAFHFNFVSGQGDNSYRKRIDEPYVPNEVRTFAWMNVVVLSR